MSPWLWICIALAVVILLLQIRLRLILRYDAAGVRIDFTFGPLFLPLYPEDPQIPKWKNQIIEDNIDFSGGSESGFQDLTSIIQKLLGKLRRGICIDELTVWYQSAAADPAAAALAFGGASAAVSLLLQPLEECIRVKKRDVQIGVSFTETKPKVIACLRISIPLWVYLVLKMSKMTRKRAGNTEE